MCFKYSYCKYFVPRRKLSFLLLTWHLGNVRTLFDYHVPDALGHIIVNSICDSP